MNLHRRQFAATLSALALATICRAATSESPPINRNRLRGLLLGALIGDALGGPLEFAAQSIRHGRTPGYRSWDDQRKITPADCDQLAQSLTLMSYRDVRPQAAAYGPWATEAPAGTITDDSRMKIILMRAIDQATSAAQLSTDHIARAVLDFQPRLNQPPTLETAALVEEGLAEYRYASHWSLGSRDLSVARPLERLWSGMPNCSGQMMMLPLAGAFAGDVEQTYRRTFELDLFDASSARDITAAIVSGLAGVISSDADSLSVGQRYQRWETTMRRVDPFDLGAVPFAGRPLIGWLDLADSIIRRADGRPKAAYDLLETEGKPVYFWDAHFTLLVPIVMLKLCQYDPLAALHLAIDFGHDTDSYTQVLGAIVGAVEGPEVFPENMVHPVTQLLSADYGESVDRWCDRLIH